MSRIGDQSPLEPTGVHQVGRDLCQRGLGNRQTLQERLGIDRPRQVRPAVEAPALHLQPRTGDQHFLHGLPLGFENLVIEEKCLPSGVRPNDGLQSAPTPVRCSAKTR